MATDNNLLLNIPFDEGADSRTAYDFAPNRHDAAITDAQFVAGKQGNCIRFDGTGKADIATDSQIIPLAGNFTLTAWVRMPTKGSYTPKRIGLFCNTPLLEGSRDVWAEVSPGSWGYVAIVKSGDTVTLYLDTHRAGSVTLPGTLTGLAVVQDLYGTDLGVADLDEVKVYNVALSQEQLTDELTSVRQLAYYIDGVNFLDLDIHVESSTGVVDFPKLKAPATVDWADYHGAVIDLAAKRVEEREITLNCWVRATGKIDFVQKVNRLYDFFRADGTARLMVDIHPTKPLVFEVYAQEGIAVTKRWHDDKMIGTFALKLREPDPVKRVVRWQRTSDTTRRVTISIATEKMVNIYWGDGTATNDLYGGTPDTPIVATHDYTTDGIYYVIVAGVIEDITHFDTNGIVVWQKL